MPNQEPNESQPAAQSRISLAQAVLAPLDAIFRAQLHAGRSFLNMLLQLGYPHRPGGAPVDAATGAINEDYKPYTLDFIHEVEVDGKKTPRQLKIPALALVPVAPLAVKSASFKFDMAVKDIERSSVLTSGNRGREGASFQEDRPWFLVQEPLSITGAIAPPATKAEAGGDRQSEQTIHIEIEVSSMKVPAGLDKLLTSLTQLASVEELPPPRPPLPSAPKPPEPTLPQPPESAQPQPLESTQPQPPETGPEPGTEPKPQ